MLTKALQDMYADGRPFTFLMPADEAIYTPFDFRLMGNDDEEGLAAQGSEELAEDYELFVEKDEAVSYTHLSAAERTRKRKDGRSDFSDSGDVLYLSLIHI